MLCQQLQNLVLNCKRFPNHYKYLVCNALKMAKAKRANGVVGGNTEGSNSSKRLETCLLDSKTVNAKVQQ